jgi:hypothetical protein
MRRMSSICICSILGSVSEYKLLMSASISASRIDGKSLVKMIRRVPSPGGTAVLWSNGRPASGVMPCPVHHSGAGRASAQNDSRTNSVSGWICLRSGHLPKNG